MYSDDDKRDEELEEHNESGDIVPTESSMDTSGMDDESKDSLTDVEAEHVEGNESSADVEDESAQQGDNDFNRAESSSDDQSPGTYSAVSLTANKRKFVVIGIVAAAVAAVYFVFTSAGRSKDGADTVPQLTPTQVERAINDSTPVTRDVDSGSAAASIPRAPLPEFATLEDPSPPSPPPPPIPEVPQTPLFGGGPAAVAAPSFDGGSSVFENRSEEANETFLAKRGENIMVLGGTSSTGLGLGANGEEGEEGEQTKKDNSGFLGFGDGQLDGDTFSKTSATQVKATRIGNLANMIAQGKMISAVLETAINTDIPGTLRAVVSRDVYSESGKRVLIPKGSRLIGEYEPEVKNGQTRVPIIWNRVILPSGFDVALSSPGTDRLGRAGVAGKLHNKFWTRLASAFLVSFIFPYGAFQLSDVGSSPTTTSSSTASDGTTTTSTTGDTESQLVADSAQKFADIATEIVQSNFSEEPTIVINQGERVKVFVNQDVIFPTQEYMNRYINNRR